MAETKTDSEVKDAKMVREFCEKLDNGVSVVQLSNKEPHYMKNFLTGNVPQGIAQIELLQGAYEQDKKGTLFVNKGQMENENLFAKKGSHAIGSVAIRKDDKYIKEGESAFNYSFVFAAEDVVKTKFVAEKDENGNDKRYEENVYSKTETYKEDRTYKDKDGKVLYEAKKGEPVLEHMKGSKIGELKGTDEALVPAKPNHLPALTDDKQLFALPKPKDENNAFEVAKCGLAKFFRGIYHGGGEGWKPSKTEIALIKNAFINKPSLFASCVKQADTYGRGNIAECQKMEKAINDKIAQKQNTASNDNTQTKSASKGRRS